MSIRKPFQSRKHAPRLGTLLRRLVNAGKGTLLDLLDREAVLIQHERRSIQCIAEAQSFDSDRKSELR